MVRKIAVAAAVGVLMMGSPAAFAQHHGGGHGGGRAVAAAPRGGGGAGPRAVAAPRAIERQSIGPRGDRAVVVAPRVVRPVVVSPRVVVAPRVVRSYGYSRPYYSSRPYYYSRPYYSFRPRARIGFGIWIGYPVAYPAYGYPVPVPYPDPYPVYTPYPYPYPPAPYPYGYPTSSGYPPTYSQPNGSVAAAPVSNVGGLSFEFSPSDAAVYVDGQYFGTVAQFTSTSQPLSLNPGRHHVEIQAQGYVPLAFDADVVAGQVTPYQGSLRPN